MSRPRFVTHPLILRQVQVLRTERVTPSLLRVTLGGPELGAFKRNGFDLPAFATPGFDDHIKLIFSADGNTESVLPMQNEHGIDWVPSENLLTRDYTPRRFDPVAGELDLEFVLHGHGPAASWAATAQAGDPLWFVGPKSSALFPDEIKQIIMLGDETALPAFARFFDERPLPAPVRGAVIINKEEARLDFNLTEHDSIDWVIGSSADAKLMDSTARALDIPSSSSTYVFAAGESRGLLPVRRYLSRELGMVKSQLNITGYWHAEIENEDDDGQVSEPATLPASPLPWLLTRTALDVGLVKALAAGSQELTELARTLALEESALACLCLALEESQIVLCDGNRIALGEAGQLLLDDEHEAEHFLGFHADQLLAVLNLPTQLHSGKTAWQLSHCKSLREMALEDSDIYEELIERAEALEFVGRAVLKHIPQADHHDLLIHGPGAVSVARLLETQALPRSITVVEDAGGLETLQQGWETFKHLRVDFSNSWVEADTGISALSSHAMTQQELAEHLAQAFKHLKTFLLLVEEGTDQLVPRAAETDLIRYAMIGQALRNESFISSMALQAGFSRVERISLGWGLACYALTH